MIRLIILILALNSFMVPVSAMASCGVMDESSNSMMMASPADSLSDMSCEMPDGTTCSSIECISSCAASIVPLSSSDAPLVLIVAGHRQSQTGLAYFYTLILPINTPPPLA